MSDIILPVFQKTSLLSNPLKVFARQLLEMLEIVTDMESTYPTKVDIRRGCSISLMRNRQMTIPEG